MSVRCTSDAKPVAQPEPSTGGGDGGGGSSGNGAGGGGGPEGDDGEEYLNKDQVCHNEGSNLHRFNIGHAKSVYA